MPPIIETRDLSKTYGRFDALQDLSISVPEGSIYALMGASGAGKTTAIKILLNMVPATRGIATVLGIDSRALRPAALAQIGYVSENQVMPPRLRVDEFFYYLRGCYPRWDRAIEKSLREQLKLPAERKIGQLSHGMRLKMALACALPFHPKLLVLDEPLSGLDALARDDIIGEFLRQSGEMSILISSHELDEVERLATHVAFIHEGRLLFQGPVATLREHARDDLAASGRPDTEKSSFRAIFIAMVRAANRDRG